MNAPVPAARLLPQAANLDLIRRLVSYDTTSRESNLALIDWIREYLAGHGVAATITRDDTGRKANLFATLPAANGERTGGGLILSGHTDVVPVDGQAWSSDPWTVVERDGNLQGRGVCDMKGFCAIVLGFVPEFLRRRLDRPLHLAFSYDEEVGCVGARRMIGDFVARGVRPAGCIVGEPTGMQVVVAHKGRRTFICRVRGHEAHSALTPVGVNAVEIACQIVSYLAAMAKRLRRDGPHDPLFDVPFTTVHVGVIHGGSALNIIPRDCHFVWEIRHLPLDDAGALFAEVREWAERTLLPEMHAVHPDTGITFEPFTMLQGMEAGADSEIVRLGRGCAACDAIGKVSFGSEAALFDAAGVPTIVCGPGHIAQAHQPDEFVSLEQLARCEQFLRRLAERLTLA